MTTTLPTQTRVTRARFGVVAFIVGLAGVTYLDRACIGTMASNIQADLHLNKDQMAWVFSAFAIAYAAFELPTAAWAQKRGTRKVLTRIVIWWSLFTFLTAATFTPEFMARLLGHTVPAGTVEAGGAGGATQPAIVGTLPWILSFGMILSMRFLFGMGEAGAWPCAAASYARWIPARERGLAQGMLFVGAHLSAAFTPILVTLLMRYAGMPWRGILVVFGCVGLVWAGAWYWWFRDDPAEHKSVGPEELAKIVAGRRLQQERLEGVAYWVRVLTNRNVLLMCLMYIGNTYLYYFCITWLPTFVNEKHHLDKASLAMAFAAGLPFWLSVGGDFVGGITTDWLTHRFGPRVGRCVLGASCYGVAALAMVVAIFATHPWVAIGALSFAVACVMFTLAAAWSTVIDVSGEHSGVVGATMNTAGNAASIFSPLITISVKNAFNDWNAPLYVIGGLIVVGTVAWLFINPRKHVFA